MDYQLAGSVQIRGRKSSKTKICIECIVDKSCSYDQSQKENVTKNMVISGVKLSGNSDKKARVQEDVEEFERL